MNSSFNFTVDKATNSIYIIREFAAELDLVWDAFTKPEILDQWWAPKPFLSKTKYMNFEVGGRRFYAMISPEGEEYWGIQDYTFINLKTNFKYTDAFADKDENGNSEMPSAIWDLNFNDQNGTTKVSITIEHKTLAELEQIIKMGFKEGFTMAMENLDTILAEQ